MAISCGEDLGPEAAMAALVAFRDGDYRDGSRELLGMKQQAWLADGLRRSAGAGKPWQVLVQQVLMGNLNTAPKLAEGLPEDLADYIRQRIIAGAMASRAELPLNMDAWDGHPAARDRVFEAAISMRMPTSSASRGHTHNAWAFDLDHAGEGGRRRIRRARRHLAGARKARFRISLSMFSNGKPWRIIASSNGWTVRAADTWRSSSLPGARANSASSSACARIARGVERHASRFREGG